MSAVKSGLLRKGWRFKSALESKLYYMINRLHYYFCMEKSSPPASRDVLSDRFLLAYLIYKARARDLGKTKIQKLVYFIESELAEKNVKAFDYDFIRSNFGAFSGRVSDDLAELKCCDVVTTRTVRTFRHTNTFFELTDNGREIIEESGELFEQNKSLISDFDAILQKYDQLPLKLILNIAYNREADIDGKLAKIKSIRKGIKLNVGVSEADSRNKLLMDDEWRETFYILFDREECKSHNAGLEDIREGRFSINEVG